MVKCDVCGKEFKNESGLGGHMRFSHPGAQMVAGTALEQLRSEVSELHERLDEVLTSAPACTLGDAVSALQSDVEALKGRLLDSGESSSELSELRSENARLLSPEYRDEVLDEALRSRSMTHENWLEFSKRLGFGFPEDMKVASCKECGKDIYLAGNGQWYHFQVVSPVHEAVKDTRSYVIVGGKKMYLASKESTTIARPHGVIMKVAGGKDITIAQG